MLLKLLLSAPHAAAAVLVITWLACAAKRAARFRCGAVAAIIALAAARAAAATAAGPAAVVAVAAALARCKGLHIDENGADW